MAGTVAILVLCAWCGWASGLHQSTAPAFVAWSVSLAGVVVVDLLMHRGRHHRRWALPLRPANLPWPRPGRGGTGPALLGTAPWSAIVLVVTVWEILGIDTGPHVAHLTISALAQAFRPLDAGLWLLWLSVGLGYGVARARTPVEGVPARSTPGASTGSLSGAFGVDRHSVGVPALLLPDNRGAGVAFWLLVVTACVLVDLTARRSRGRLADAGELVRFVSGSTLANLVFSAAWAYAGWHLFAH
ncbi:MAG: hypothetical protein ABSC41_04760 [Acidimicrobiales bacterium]